MYATSFVDYQRVADISRPAYEVEHYRFSQGFAEMHEKLLKVLSDTVNELLARLFEMLYQ